MLFWNGTPDRSGEEPGQGVRRPVRQPGDRARRRNADVQLQKDLLAFTAGEVQSLQTTLQSQTGRQTKLATHLASIQALQRTRTTMVTPSVCSSKPNLPSVEMVRTQSAGNMPPAGGGNDYFYMEKNFQLLLAAQLELITQAMICNVAPVIGLMPMFATCDFELRLRERARDRNPPGAVAHDVPGQQHRALRPVQLAAQHQQPADRHRTPVRDRADVVLDPARGTRS
jgi:hypothetical protein